MASRHIILDGTPNLRDLGGYPTQCGRKVRHNRLFRSGSLAYLTDRDWETLGTLNIRVICDFRYSAERAEEQTVVPKGLDIDIVHLDINAGNHVEFIRNAIHVDNEKDGVMEEFMCNINRMFALDFQSSFAGFFEQLQQLNDNDALLFHCSAGKDRTGFAAAMLLSCLNVARDTVINDYLLTAKYYVPEIEIPKIKERWSGIQSNNYDAERLKPMLQVRPEYIDEAFKTIDNHYPSLDHYLNDALGIDTKRTTALQHKFLEH